MLILENNLDIFSDTYHKHSSQVEKLQKVCHSTYSKLELKKNLYQIQDAMKQDYSVKNHLNSINIAVVVEEQVLLAETFLRNETISWEL